jgi:2-methylisocitrate lyase-like PEP mutase family enzyme
MDSKADILRNLHRPVLVLPNAWDAASAVIFERAGFPAIGTSSAGIAFALGYPDGQRISRAEMIEVVGRIARAVRVPVTADVEAGYGDPVETARAVWSAGAVGMNLEDTDDSGTLDTAAAVRAIRAAVPGMVINARTDIFWKQMGEESTRFERAVESLNAYRDAGADCLFAPGIRDRETIGRLVKAVRGPLNVLGSAGSPPIAEMKSLGVARVSVGSGPMRAAMGLTERMARELHDRGTYASMLEGAIPYAEANRMFERGSTG